MMNRKLGIWGSTFLITAVAFGAFGAHSLKGVLDANSLGTFHTGVEYQFIHGLGLLLFGLSKETLSVKFFRWAGNLMIIGVFLFSGSLYLLSMQVWMSINISFLGPITPLGGLCFILGWLFTLIGFLRQ